LKKKYLREITALVDKSLEKRSSSTFVERRFAWIDATKVLEEGSVDTRCR